MTTDNTGVDQLRKEYKTCAGIQIQGNESYIPSATCILESANPAYGTNIANAPEIPTDNNVAYTACGEIIDK